MCIFESDTVNSDCPMEENYERFNKDRRFTLLVLLYVLEILKKKKKKAQKMKKKTLKMTSHYGSQLVIFRAFFRLPDPKSEKKIPVNQLIKKLALISFMTSGPDFL